MYADLQTSVAEKSPLLGLLKIDQIAFISRCEEDTQTIKKQLRLQEADWIEDEVIARGHVRGAGRNARNHAKLLFNYDFGIELEILQYLEGENYADINKVRSLHMCHIGAHVERGKELPDALKNFTVASPIIQQVETISHTNKFLRDTGRRYRYTIYDTKPVIGVHFKVIERLHNDTDIAYKGS